MKDIIAKVAVEAGMSVSKTTEIVKAFFEALGDEMQKEAVTVTYFGKFSVGDVKSRKGVNPKTGESIVIPAMKRVRFQPSSTLKRKANG